MNLDVIKPRDTLRGRVWCYKDEDSSLTTSDIRRCRPGAFKYLEKIDTKTPYDGDRARTLYPPRASQAMRPTDLSLTTKDIPGGTPGLGQDKKLSTNRVVNPLQPHYNLASHEVADPAPPQVRFAARHTNDISDIELTHPKKAVPSRNHVPDALDVSDIQGAAPKKLTWTRAQDQVEDHGRPAVPTCRPICPLDPHYPVPTTNATSLVAAWTEENSVYSARPSSRSPDFSSHTIGPVSGSKPRRVHQDNGETQLSLFTQDIEGGVPQRWIGKIPINCYGPQSARPCFHDPSDIHGSKADSVSRGIEWSSRRTNPLEPNYPEIRGSTHKHHPGCEIIEGERGHIKRPVMNRAASEVRNSGGHKRRQG